LKKNLNFRFSGQRILPKSKVTYLDIQLDEHLTWNSYLNKLIPKLGIFSKLRHYVNYQILRSIYYALFNSHLGTAFKDHITFESLDKISKLQNKAIRIIHCTDNRTSAKPLYLQSRILPIYEELKLKNCLLAFDILRTETVRAFHNFCKIIGENQEH